MISKKDDWEIIARRLAGEATLPQLQEIDDLLKKYSGAGKRVKLIANWWRGYIHEEITRRGAQLFEKIKEKINTKENGTQQDT